MTQNNTPEKLTAQQQRAIDHLIAGETVTAVAGEVHVDRSTVHRWLREDSAFQAAYNQRRGELQEAYATRILSLADRAIATVEDAVVNGDVRASLKVLDGLGLLPGKPPAIGPDNEESIDLARRRRQNEHEERRMLASLGV